MSSHRRTASAVQSQYKRRSTQHSTREFRATAHRGRVRSLIDSTAIPCRALLWLLANTHPCQRQRWLRRLAAIRAADCFRPIGMPVSIRPIWRAMREGARSERWVGGRHEYFTHQQSSRVPDGFECELLCNVAGAELRIDE
jgi:hypothetical protein